MNGEIIHIHEGGLVREVWTFWLNVNTGHSAIYLDKYTFQSRPTGRHKFRVEKIYNRLDRCSNTTDDPRLIEDVIKEIQRWFAGKILELPVEM